ncbi:tripartite tricarboxylate transporter substrate binding protein [soil metagenome]
MKRRRVLQCASAMAATVVASVATQSLINVASAADAKALVPATSGTGAAGSTRSWPSRPINVVVPFAAGSSPDTVARIVLSPLAAALGQPFVIENRPGQGGNLGVSDVAKAHSDGYTFVYTIQGPLVTAPLLFKSLSYDPVEDLAPVTLVATSPNVLVVSPKLPASTVADFVRLAKERKGELFYGSVGVGSAAHLAMELFKARAGIDLKHVAFQSLPEVVTAMKAGQIQAAIMVPAVAVGPVRDGDLRALGVTTLGRVASLPEMATLAEQGFPGFEAIAWHAVLAPDGTPREVLDRMSTELVRIIKSDNVRTQLTAQYFSAAGTAPEALAGLLRTERDRWAKVINAAHVRAE